MPIIKWTPFDEMDRFFDDWHKPAAPGFVPAVDVYETKNEVVVETQLVGVDPKNVKIAIENDVLTIRGEAKKESEVDEKNYYRKEISAGSFFRSVILPAHVVSDKAKAESVEGLLKITIPKAPDTQPKTIKIDVKKPNKK